MRRVAHPYHTWEDYQAGMFYQSDRTAEHITLAQNLLANPEDLHKAMMQVCQDWPRATEHNLTLLESNRRAWLGAAACCIKHGSPEHATRVAWWSLTDSQRAAANQVADSVVSEWEEVRVGARALFSADWSRDA